MDLGGRQQSREDIDKMRQEQERKQQMEARFAKVRQRVSTPWRHCVLCLSLCSLIPSLPDLFQRTQEKWGGGEPTTFIMQH